jgi:hypothetical protein
MERVEMFWLAWQWVFMLSMGIMERCSLMPARDPEIMWMRWGVWC